MRRQMVSARRLLGCRTILNGRTAVRLLLGMTSEADDCGTVGRFLRARGRSATAGRSISSGQLLAARSHAHERALVPGAFDRSEGVMASPFEQLVATLDYPLYVVTTA